MTDIEELKQIVLSTARFAENAMHLAEQSLRRSDDNQHALLVMQQQMLAMQSDMKGIQAEMLEVKRDIKGLQQENRRILDVLLNQRGEE